jgi:ribonuclease R
LYVEGLVHISELGKDYFHFDATKHQLLGERTGQRYRLGDRVQVRVVKVDMESTKIDFVLHELIDTAGEGRSTGKKSASDKSSKGKAKEKKRRG